MGSKLLLIITIGYYNHYQSYRRPHFLKTILQSHSKPVNFKNFSPIHQFFINPLHLVYIHVVYEHQTRKKQAQQNMQFLHPKKKNCMYFQRQVVAINPLLPWKPFHFAKQRCSVQAEFSHFDNRAFESVVFNSGQKMAMRALYSIRTLT